MNIVVLSDIHGDTRRIAAMGEYLRRCDLAVLAGDITHFGGKKEVETIVTAVREFNTNILAVHGNCDTPQVMESLAELGVNASGLAIVKDGVVLVGLGGSLPCPAKTPCQMQEEAFREGLDAASADAPENLPMVLLTHQPPFGVKADKAMKLFHVGSKAIREFIETKRPVLSLCGHIHEARSVDAIGQTCVVNPGPFKNGHFAVVEIRGGVVSADLKSA